MAMGAIPPFSAMSGTTSTLLGSAVVIPAVVITILRIPSGGGREAALRVDNDARRIWAGHPSDCQLRIVGKCGPDPNHHRVDQRPQAVQVDQTGLAVDIVGVPARGGNAAIDRLATLCDQNKVVDRPSPQRPENVLPRGGEETISAAKAF